MIPFIIILIKKGAVSSYEPNFRIYEDGIEIVKTNKFFEWKKIDRIEIIKHSIWALWVGGLIGIIHGNFVDATGYNLNHEQIEEVKKIIEKFNVKVVIK